MAKYAYSFLSNYSKKTLKASAGLLWALIFLALTGCEPGSDNYPETGVITDNHQHSAVQAVVDKTSSQKQLLFQEELPPRNPFYADSTAGAMHGGAGYGRFAAVAGPVNLDRPLQEDEVIWRAAELASWGVIYSGPYPDGRRVAWAGGGTILHKFDADTLAPLATVRIRDGDTMSQEDMDAYIKQLDGMDDPGYYKLAVSKMLPEMRKAATASYKVVSNENEVYTLVYDASEQKTYLRVYGDVITGDPASAIELKRQWALPRVEDVEPLGFSLNLTYDGRVIVTTVDGTLYAITRDLKQYTYLVLPRQPEELTDNSKGFRASDAFVRNATPVDPDGGIYIVTKSRMHRVQWTGEMLSLDEKDGAWSAPYAGGEVGSGTTPALMGWGENEDQLVIIGDGRPDGKMNLWAFWRNKIPEDWQGIEGLDRRVAGIAPIDYGQYTPKQGTIENSLPVKGYGVLVSNDYPPSQPDYEGGTEEKLFVHYYAVSKNPEYVPHGAIRYNWNPATRKLEKVWQTDLSLSTSIPVVDINDRVYAIGHRDGVFTVEALDWNSGKSEFFYNLGASNRFNPNGSSVMIAPNGALDCYCQGGGGIVRIKPKQQPVAH